MGRVAAIGVTKREVRIMTLHHASTSRRTTITRAIIITTALAIVLTLGFLGSQATAQDKAGPVISANSGVFTGSNDEGQFQLALEDAVQQAATAAGCCDIRITYKVLETTGQQGGFVFFDDVFVKILAEW